MTDEELIAELNSNIDALAEENQALHIENHNLRRGRAAMIRALLVLCQELEEDADE